MRNSHTMFALIALTIGCVTLVTMARPEVIASRNRRIKTNMDRPCLKYDVNGCSVPFGLPFFYKDQFTPSCDRHDVCYSCGVAYDFSKSACDLAFRHDTQSTCSVEHLSQDSRNQAELVLNAIKDLGFEGVQVLLSETMPKITTVLPYPGLPEFNNWFASHGNQVKLLADWVMKVSIRTHDLEEEHSDIDELDTIALLYEKAQQEMDAIISKLNHDPDVLTFRAESLLRASSLDVQELCTEVLDYLAAQGETPIVAGSPLGCDVVSYIICDFFSEVYYLAVVIFGLYGYRTDPAYYCNEDWVQGCLPQALV